MKTIFNKLKKIHPNLISINFDGIEYYMDIRFDKTLGGILRIKDFDVGSETYKLLNILNSPISGLRK